MSRAPGAMIGPYHIIEQVGRGGMGTVYKAYHASLARYVAIKVLTASFAEDEGFRERFQQEAIAIAKLRHSAILVVFDYGEEDGVTYLVSEFIDGGTLADQVGRPLPLDYTLGILGPVATALDFAHTRGILHRDIKPSNILLARDGTPVLSDFGLAKIIGSLPRLTKTGMTVGTPEYMAPEQGLGAEVGPAADRYALAVVAYEMLTGKVPFSAETPIGVVLAHMHEPLPLPRSVNPNLSAGIEEVLIKGLAKSPDDRYRTATALVAALREADPGRLSAAQSVITTPRTTPPPPMARPPSQSVPAAPEPVVIAERPITPPVAPRDAGSAGTQPRRRLPRYAVVVLIVAALLAAAGGGELLRSSGGGQTGTTTPTARIASVSVKYLRSNLRLFGISCPGARTCFAAGDSGTIVATTDGGQTWPDQTSGTSNALQGISCPDITVCYAVGRQGTILATTLGAMTSGTAIALHDISCPTSTSCYAIGDSGTIVATTDGGEVWQRQFSGTAHALHGLSCQAITTCYAVGDNGVVVTTTDGGATWRRQTSGTGNTLNGISCSAAACYAVGVNGTILASTDGGATWLSQASGTGNILNDISCSAATCYAVGEKGTILASTDGGATWHRQTSRTVNALNGISCPSTTTCDVVGTKGTMVTLRKA